MELTTLTGNIIGVITNVKNPTQYQNETIAEIIKNKTDDSLKMVDLSISNKETKFQDLTPKEQNKCLLASQLQKKEIIVYNFTKGMLNKELIFYKNLFKKICSYNKKIIIVGNDIEFLLNLVDHIYVMKNDNIIFHTTNLFDLGLYQHVKMPKIIKFIELARDKKINIPDYQDFDELLKAIYRIKS